MTCHVCVHWVHHQKDKLVWRNENKTGLCTLYPEWKETSSDHFCGQRVEIPEATYVDYKWKPKNSMWKDMVTNVRRTANEDYFKRKEAEKENKALRRLYKEKTGKTAVIRKKS